MTKKLGLTLQYPDGYLDAPSTSGSHDQSSEEDESTPKKRGRKRKLTTNRTTPSNDKSKQPRYELTTQQKKLIKSDTINSKLWNELLETCDSAGLLERIQETFTCIVCQELVYKPISTPCGHNICCDCLQRSFKADVHSCPFCRHQLGAGYELEVNSQLQSSLIELFPGYEGGRR